MDDMKLQHTLLAFALIAFSAVANGDERVLFQFDAGNASNAWRSVNDGVMGGRSVGRYRINEDKNLEFFGNLSLRNNGGFASVRATGKNLAMKKEDSIVIRVKGDGRTYQFNLYSGSNMGGYSYRQSFETRKNEWIEVRFPVNQFVATWRGRVYRNQRLDPAKVSGLGILLGDKKEGAFKLEVDWIKVDAG